MPTELAVILTGLGFLAIIAFSYTWGWQAGHDVHHVDDKPTAPPPPPPTDKLLWR